MVIILICGISCLISIVMLVVRLLLLIGINMWLRWVFCWSSFSVSVFCLVIIIGWLNGGIQVNFCCCDSLIVLVFVLLKFVLWSSILLLKLCIVLILMLVVVVGIMIRVFMFNCVEENVMFCVWLFVEVVIMLCVFCFFVRFVIMVYVLCSLKLCIGWWFLCFIRMMLLRCDDSFFIFCSGVICVVL